MLQLPTAGAKTNLGGSHAVQGFRVKLDRVSWELCDGLSLKQLYGVVKSCRAWVAKALGFALEGLGVESRDCEPVPMSTWILINCALNPKP